MINIKTLFYYVIITYSFIKELLGIPKGAIKKKSLLTGILLQACLFVLTIISILLILLLLIPFQLFLWGMDFYLAYKLGDNYGGRLKGQDAQFEANDEKISISVLLVLNHNDKDEVVFKKIHMLCKKVHNSISKFSCTVEKCMGYSYYVKNQVPAEGSCVFTKINDEVYLTKEAFMEYIHKKHMVRIINEKRLWYVKLFTQPILWNKKSETHKQVAMLLTFRHCLADGVSLIGTLKNFMIREENPELMRVEAKYSTTPNFSFDDAYIYRNPFMAKKDANIFDVPNSERQISFYLEDEVKYVPLVKKIKSKLGVGFTEILVSGFTASLNEFLSNKGKTMDKCAMAVLYRPINEDLIGIINGTYDYNNLTNDSGIVMVYVPITMKQTSTMKDRTKAISCELEKAKYSTDGLAYYEVCNLSHLMPTQALKACVGYLSHMTAGATNVGGLRGGTIEGYELETALSFIAYYYLTYFRLSIISKADRFQLALTTKENVLYNRNEAQLILNNTFKFIDQLYKEVEND